MPWDTSLDTRARNDYRRSHRLSMREGGILHNWQTSAIDTTVVAVADRLYAQSFWLPDTMRVAKMICEVTTGSAGNIQLGLYRDLNGYPDTRVFVETQITTASAAGIKVQAVNLTLPSGFYWGVTHFSSTPTMRADNIADGAPWLGLSTVLDVTTRPGIIVTRTFAALPDPFTASATLITTAIPRILITMGKYGNLP